ncbi:MAG: extracellular solute-binding protein [Treponema sp.]|nr:extracellular solute-binding protein [Treponema sp.]
MKTAKKTLFLVCLIVLSLVVQGLAFAGGGGQQGTAAIDTSKPVELVYWHHEVQNVDNYRELAKIATEIFAKLGYPNITMRSEQIEYQGYLAKYQAAFASGTGPDMFMAMANDWALEGGANPVALPLPADVQKVWQDALPAVYRNDGMFNGKYYGPLAHGATFMFLYVNTDHLKEAGLSEDYYPKTLDEFRDLAKKLTKYDASGKVIRAGWQPRFAGGSFNVAAKYMPFIHNFGGQVLSSDLKRAQGYVNGPDTVKAFQYLRDLVIVDKVTNVELGLPDVAFQQGLCSMTIREPFYAEQSLQNNPNLKFKIYPFPAGSKDLITLGGGSWHMMINSKSKYADLLVKMYKELANPEYDIRAHQINKTVPILAANLTINNPYFGKLPFAQAVIGSMNKTVGPLYYTIPEWNSLSEIIGDAVAQIIEGKDVKATLDDAAAKMQQILDER